NVSTLHFWEAQFSPLNHADKFFNGRFSFSHRLFRLFQIRHDFGELTESGLESFSDSGGNCRQAKCQRRDPYDDIMLLWYHSAYKLQPRCVNRTTSPELCLCFVDNVHFSL